MRFAGESKCSSQTTAVFMMFSQPWRVVSLHLYRKSGEPATFISETLTANLWCPAAKLVASPVGLGPACAWPAWGQGLTRKPVSRSPASFDTHDSADGLFCYTGRGFFCRVRRLLNRTLDIDMLGARGTSCSHGASLRRWHCFPPMPLQTQNSFMTSRIGDRRSLFPQYRCRVDKGRKSCRSKA